MNITTSIPDEIYNLAREKNLKWNEMLILGIRTTLNAPFKLQKGESITEETWKAKAENIQHTMQACIDELNLKIDKLETSKDHNGKK